MVIEVPDYKEEGQPDTLRRLIMRAIGIDISKNA
jgi:vacuolar-type H+-ATPase subunit F/Vma7